MSFEDVLVEEIEEELEEEEVFSVDIDPVDNMPEAVVSYGDAPVIASVVDEAARNKPEVQPIMRRTSYQARLGQKLDRISKKFLDNQIRLTSHPTDMIRIKTKRDPRSQDSITRTVQSAEIIPVILPVMKDIPMRRFIREDGHEVLVPSLYPTNETTVYELYVPFEIKMDEDDLLLRLIEDPALTEPYVLCLQIKEILGTLGYSSFRYQKFWATLYDEPLPPQIIKAFKEAVKKRTIIGW